MTVKDTDRVLYPWVDGKKIPGRFPLMRATCPGCGISAWMPAEEERTHQCGNTREAGFGTCTQRYNVRLKS